MGIRFLHTADWQIGMKANHVAKVAETVRSARLTTAERIVAVAKDEDVDFILIAGDLFEDNAVGNDVVHRVVHILEQATPIPVYILPGNHDLLSPGSVYERAAFRQVGNIHVLRSTEPILLHEGEVALLPAPITQKNSERDPTTHLQASDAPIRIGVAHGSPRIEGMYQPDDHPIALDAAARLGLDYLAIGHWHSWLELGPRMLMPGTHEPTKFDEASGYVALVTCEGGGAPPHVEQVAVNTLRWAEGSFQTDGTPDALERQVRTWVEGLADPKSTLVRVQLAGPMSAEVEAVLRELEDWLAVRTLYAEVDTRQTTPTLSQGRLREIAIAHPFLEGLLADLGRLATLAGPELPAFAEAAAGRDDDEDGGPIQALDVDELRALMRENDLEIDPDVIKEAIRQLAHRAGEVWE